MAELKLCKDCKFAVRSYFPAIWNPMEFAKCSVNDKHIVNLVTGRLITHARSYCSTQRSMNYHDYCGEEGKFFLKKGK